MRLPLFVNTLGTKRALAGAALLAAGMCSGQLTSGNASAAISYCRTDPIVHLSNAADVHLSAAIGDSAADVQQVTYVVHVPSWATETGVTFTGHGWDSKENVQVVPDQSGNTYVADVVVSTGAGAAVTVTATVPSVGSSSASGQSGDHLVTTVNG